MPHKNTQTIYQEYETFKQTAKKKKITVGRKTWEYYTIGSRGPVILFLHGGGSTAENEFRYAVQLSESSRVIIPTIPAGVDTVHESIVALKKIIAREKVTKFHVIGISLGGMLGQILTLFYPKRVETMTLIVSMLPSPRYARKYRPRALGLQLLPPKLLKIGAYLIISYEVSRARFGSLSEKRFWIRDAAETFSKKRLTKEVIMARAHLILDYFAMPVFSRADFADWKGRVLIIDAARDEMVDRIERTRIQALYRGAINYTIKNEGHVESGLFHVDEIVATIKKFYASKRGHIRH